ncbi:MAG TPA: Gfo/Idh/MocA family oxidoreductase [Candidatus Lumbricidophila sp.]|nr:Gfo/Idh/MocA family oxidoreductase [Candidatus Lumbricidophila sp.]
MPLRMGIIGYGHRAGYGFREELAKPENDAELTAIWDPSPASQARAIAEVPGVRVASSLDDLLSSGIDAVMVLSPDFDHAASAIAALRAGIPVFCEKPITIDTADADEMLRVAYETKTRLYIGHNMRHLPMVRIMRDLILAGRIGEVKAVWCRHFVGNGGDYYFKDWHADRSKSNSLLLQKGAHDIDVIHWLAGAPSASVVGMGGLTVYGQIEDREDRSGQMMHDWISYDNWPPLTQKGLNPVVDVEDISMMMMQLRNGVFASYQQCHYTPDYWRNYTVIGTEGRIENFGDGAPGVIKVWTSRGGYTEADEIIPIPEADGGHGGADEALVKEFLNFVRHGGATETSPVAARDSVAAGVAATDSIRGNGCPVVIPPVSDELQAYFAAQP